MPSDCISFRDTNYFSSFICDYLDKRDEVSRFYNRFPSIENFKSQIEEKSKNYNNDNRQVLHKVILEKYSKVSLTDETKENIELLKNSNTFTITTGHQLNLFSGPLYFLYKIISTINLTAELKHHYPDYNFVPIYWMATEDHDFDEINYFNFEGKKVQWNRESSGGVGRLNTKGLDKVFEVFCTQLPNSKNAESIKSLFQDAYLKHDNLADATLYFANALFGDLGLVIVDADHTSLKQLFVTQIKNELLLNNAQKYVEQTNSKISALNYKVQVNPREINLFYLKDNVRERIVKKEELFKTNDEQQTWSQAEILDEVDAHPERFSPNVIMRPLYQEVILPNLCYIGGGGEMAYWFQLNSYFNIEKVTFPILLLRNSVLITTSKQKQKLDKLGLSYTDVFQKQGDLVNSQVKKASEISIDLTPQKNHLKTQFKELYKLAEQTDQSFIGAVAAQERKQTKGLENLEKRLLIAQKRKMKDVLDRITSLQNELFPLQSLQERNTNFSEFYLEYGDQLIQQLVLNLQPLKSEFLILEL